MNRAIKVLLVAAAIVGLAAFLLQTESNTKPVLSSANSTLVQVDVGDTAGQLVPGPEPKKQPSLIPGQRFLAVPWQNHDASTSTEYYDAATKKSITWDDLAAKIFVLRKVEAIEDNKMRLFFDMEGYSGQVCLESAQNVDQLPLLTPVFDEPVVKKLQAKYNGRKVWCYGGAGGNCISRWGDCSASCGGSILLPLILRRVERVYAKDVILAVGSAPGYMGERKSEFTATNPLVAILEVPSKGMTINAFISNSEKVPDITTSASSSCIALWNTFADSWDFEREYSLKHPFKSHPEWPARMRKAMLKGELKKGMTHEMVAWVMGWPSEQGTKEDLKALDQWTYDSVLPFTTDIYFKGDHMLRFEQPTLP